MIDPETIDKAGKGWGLLLDEIRIKEVLERLLWGCINPEEFRQRCEFIFNNPSMTFCLMPEKRSATIWLDGGKEITASVSA